MYMFMNRKETAVEEAFDTYIHARDMAMSHDIALAPIEIKA